MACFSYFFSCSDRQECSSPEVKAVGEDENSASRCPYAAHKTSIWQFSHLLLGCLVLFLYVGVETAMADLVRFSIFFDYAMIGYKMGVNVDIAGEEIPRRSVLPERLVPSLPSVFGAERVESERIRLKNAGEPLRVRPVGVSHSANMADPEKWVNPLRGYAYDSFNKDALLRLAKAESGHDWLFLPLFRFRFGIFRSPLPNGLS